MKQRILTLAAAGLLLASCGSKQAPELESQLDSISWVVGRSMAESITATGLEVDHQMVLRAVEATLNGDQQPLDQQTYQDILAHLTMQVEIEQRKQAQSQAQDAAQRQADFFAKLAKEKPHLLKSPNGILYEPIKKGSGRMGKPGEVAVFHYRSYTAFDNKVYDQTYGNRDAIIHVIGSPMMPAMIEALTLIPAGSTYRFYFPFEATAGVEGIEPYTPLIYDIELLEIR